MVTQQDVRDKFALILVAEMVINRISIRQLAKKSGVSVSAIVSYRNASRDVPLPKVVAMAEAMEINPKSLVPTV